jgi:hypothetical protein
LRLEKLLVIKVMKFYGFGDESDEEMMKVIR